MLFPKAIQNKNQVKNMSQKDEQLNNLYNSKMDEMSIEDYTEYVETSLLFVDENKQLLRTIYKEYPIASTQAQLEVLIVYLNKIKPLLKP